MFLITIIILYVLSNSHSELALHVVQCTSYNVRRTMYVVHSMNSTQHYLLNNII